MVNIELIYDSDCPNAEPARDILKQALTQAGLDAKWQEWDRADVKSPEYVQRYGPPTILVDRKDIAGESPEDSCRSCRVYKDENGRLGGIPSVTLISTAIEKARQTTAKQAGIVHNQKGGYKGHDPHKCKRYGNYIFHISLPRLVSDSIQVLLKLRFLFFHRTHRLGVFLD